VLFFNYDYNNHGALYYNEQTYTIDKFVNNTMHIENYYESQLIEFIDDCTAIYNGDSYIMSDISLDSLYCERIVKFEEVERDLVYFDPLYFVIHANDSMTIVYDHGIYTYKITRYRNDIISKDIYLETDQEATIYNCFEEHYVSFWREFVE
jgi:hypothetical protein